MPNAAVSAPLAVAGSELAGQSAAIIEPSAVGADEQARSLGLLARVLQRLPTLLNSQIEDLLPHRWAPASA